MYNNYQRDDMGTPENNTIGDELLKLSCKHHDKSSSSKLLRYAVYLMPASIVLFAIMIMPFLIGLWSLIVWTLVSASLFSLTLAGSLQFFINQHSEKKVNLFMV